MLTNKYNMTKIDGDNDYDGKVKDSLAAVEAYKVLFTRLKLIIHQKALALHDDNVYEDGDKIVKTIER